MTNRCFDAKAPRESQGIGLQAHDVGWIITSCFTVISCMTSFWLIDKHLIWYNNKKEQRYIVRILFMVPIYSVVSSLSYFFWDDSTPVLLLRDCYESFVLTAFFYLLLTYLSPNPDVQRSIFRKQGFSKENDDERTRKGEEPRKWVFPMAFVTWKPQDGLYFLQLMKWGILQYCVLRPVTTFFAVVLNYVGLYCEDSWSPAYGHLYLAVVVSLSVTIAMYCLLSMYVSVSSELADKQPVLKLISIKAIVFLTFWQATFLSLLTTFGVVKDTPYMTAEDIEIGWGAILETFEMVIFGFIHIKAFSYAPYRPVIIDADTPRTPRLRSLAHVLNFKETLRELRDGWIYMWQRTRGREAEADRNARRGGWYEGVFGKERLIPAGDWKDPGKRGWNDKNAYAGDIGSDHRYGCGNGCIERGLEVDREVIVSVEGERQWLGAGDEYGYGVGYESRSRAGVRERERSEALGTQIVTELSRRGYELTVQDEHLASVEQRHMRGCKSWWRELYDRVSQSHQNPDILENEDPLTPSPRRNGSRASRCEQAIGMDREFSERRALMDQYEYDDAPPPSIINTYRSRHSVDITRTPPSQLPQEPSSKPPPKVHLRQTTVPTPDSMLERVFPSDVGHSSATTPSTVPSSQSHRTHVALGSTPIVITRGGDLGRIPEHSSYLPSHPESLYPTTENGDRIHRVPRHRDKDTGMANRYSSSRSRSHHHSHPGQPTGTDRSGNAVLPTSMPNIVPGPSNAGRCPHPYELRTAPTPIMPALLSPTSESYSLPDTPSLPQFSPLTSPESVQPSSPSALRHYSSPASAYSRPVYVRQPTKPWTAKEHRRP